MQTSRTKTINPGFGGFIAVSLFIHAAAFGLLRLPKPAAVEEPVYYVDLGVLPTTVAAGEPTKTIKTEPAEPAEQTAPASQTVPSRPPGKPAPVKAAAAPEPVPSVKPLLAQTAPVRQTETAEKEYQEQIEKLAHAAEAARVAKRIAEISSRSRPGDPGAAVGYGSYLQSRLNDAFEKTMRGESRSSSALLMIAISGSGRLESVKITTGSDSPQFDQSAIAAVTLAAKTLAAPPGGKKYTADVVFRPAGVSGK